MTNGKRVSVTNRGRSRTEEATEPTAFHNQKRSVKEAPRDEVPPGAVPEAAEEKDNQNISVKHHTRAAHAQRKE